MENKEFQENSDEATLAQQLALLNADRERFEDIRERCIQLYEEYDNYALSLNRLNTNNADMCKKLEELEKENIAMHQRLKDLQSSSVEVKSVEETVKNLSCLLGFTITEYSTSKQGIFITLHFNELCFLHLQKDDIYDVLEIHPEPENFVAIKKYLFKSQDIQGFLITVRKFFKYATSRLMPPADVEP